MNPLEIPLGYIMFPAPTSSYDPGSFPGKLGWIPRDLKIFDSNVQSDMPADSIPCIFITDPESDLWLVYSHGNGCDIGHMYQTMQLYAANFGANCVAFEYVGYGINKGRSSAAACKRDHEIVIDFLIKIMQVNPRNIILFGRSIGTGVASHACAYAEKTYTDQGIGALVLQSPYYDINNLAEDIGSSCSSVLPNSFDNASNLEKIRTPLLLIHGKLDRLIPPTHSERLFDVAASPIKKIMLCDSADHNNWVEYTHVIQPIKSLLIQANARRHPKQNSLGYIPPLVFVKPKPTNYSTCTIL